MALKGLSPEINLVGRADALTQAEGNMVAVVQGEIATTSPGS
ncbi:MAG: hypothetical protein ACPLSY_14570 [Moorellaceae bacterium]